MHLKINSSSLPLLLSHFSRVRLCATPKTAAHQAPLCLGFSRQEHWSELPFPSPVLESEKWKWSYWVVSNSQRPHGLQPTRLLRSWDFPGKSAGVGCHSDRLICAVVVLGGCILDYIYKWYHMVLSFARWLTYLSMIISRSIHVAADGIISFFVMTE